MNIEDLHDAIFADTVAKNFADAGNDVAAAERISSLLDPVLRDAYVTEVSILSVLGPVAGDAAMTSLEAAAEFQASQGSKLLSRTVRILQTERGLNLGDAATRAQLDALQVAGVLQPAWVEALKAHGEEQPTVNYNDVSAAWARYRVMFRNEGPE